jgi:hypothetical protein
MAIHGWLRQQRDDRSMLGRAQHSITLPEVMPRNEIICGADSTPASGWRSPVTMTATPDPQ